MSILYSPPNTKPEEAFNLASHVIWGLPRDYMRVYMHMAVEDIYIPKPEGLEAEVSMACEMTGVLNP